MRSQADTRGPGLRIRWRTAVARGPSRGLSPRPLGGEGPARRGLQRGHNYIGTEHMLLGLVREGEGVAAQVLISLGADLAKVRQQVIQLLSGYQGKESG